MEVHDHIEQKLGVHADENEMVYNLLPLYYRRYECGILDIDPAYAGGVFEAVADECEFRLGITMFDTPGH